MKKCIGLSLLAGLFGLAGLAPTVRADHLGGCCPVVIDSCQEMQLKKVCVPQPGKKTITKTVYGDKCVDFCLPKCSLGGGLFSKGCCDSGECADCEKPRTKKVLIKKTKSCGEVDVINCKVETTCEPACKKSLFDGLSGLCGRGHAAPCHDGLMMPATPAPELLPPPKPK